MLEALLVSLLLPHSCQRPPDPDAGWIEGLHAVDERFADGRRGRWGGAAPHVFGYALAALGDIDGDGAVDLAVGTPVAHAHAGEVDPWRGFVSVLSGKSGEELYRVEGVHDGDQAGKSLAAIGDWNDDGVQDLFVGGVSSRGPFVVSGADGETTARFWIEKQGDVVAAPAGDEGDAVLLGFPEFELRGRDRGMVSFLSQGERRDLLGESAGDGFGWALAGAARLDEDDIPDFLASAHRGNVPRRSCADRAGVVRAFWGATGRRL